MTLFALFYFVATELRQNNRKYETIITTDQLSHRMVFSPCWLLTMAALASLFTLTVVKHHSYLICIYEVFP